METKSSASGKIHCFLAFNKSYAPHARAAMKSVLANTRTQLVFYILHTDLGDDDMGHIAALKTKHGCTVDFIQIDKSIFKDFRMCIKHITLETCFRLMIPELKPGLDKAIYLDSDVIVRHDIKELWETDVSNVYAGVVEDLFCPPNYRKLFAPNRYFNAGIILFNCKEIRKAFSLKKLLEIEQEHRHDFSCQDQDVLNYAFAGKVKFLSPKWNVSHCFFEPKRKMSPFLGYSGDEIKTARENAAIVHFLGTRKPWLLPCGMAASPYACEYFKYAEEKMSANQTLWNAIRFTIRHLDTLVKPRCYKMWRIRLLLKKQEAQPFWKSLYLTRKLAQAGSCFILSKEKRNLFRDKIVCDWIKRFLMPRFRENFSYAETMKNPGQKIPKIIWQYWDKGAAAAPPIVLGAFAFARKFAAENDYKHIILDDKNVREYADISDKIFEHKKTGKIKTQSFSDILRLELLRKYGGVWLDATCLLANPFPQWMADTDFFVYRTTGKITPLNLIQSCLIFAAPDSYLITAWAWCVREFWKLESRTSEYFYIHKIFKTLVECDLRAKAEFEKMPCFDNDLIHRLQGLLHEQYDETSFRLLTNSKDAVCQKLSRWQATPFPSGSIGAHICQIGLRNTRPEIP